MFRAHVSGNVITHDVDMASLLAPSASVTQTLASGSTLELDAYSTGVTAMREVADEQTLDKVITFSRPQLCS